ncbi:response regulator [Hyphobacterium sp.]|uniref:response regulator n=1 Tax=Hyphobacterium sp. TaxID=2004662 RepID=UPI003BACC1A8
MAGSFDRIRVLIVEDNPHMSAILRTILQGFGVRTIHECRDAETALQNLGSINPDILLVDLFLAEMDGLELARRVRSDDSSANKYLPIIMVTAHSERARVIQAINAGINEYLAKPVRPIDLFERIVSLVERPRRFVKTPGYFGPDRRRRQDSAYKGPWRRSTDEQYDDDEDDREFGAA